MRRAHVLHFCRWMAGCVLALAWPVFSRGAEPPPEPALPLVTNIFQFDCLAARTPHATFALQLEGAVRWAKADGSLIVLEDDSGAAIVETEPQVPSIQPGQKIHLTGDASANGYGAGVRIGGRLLADNDGAHASREKSASVFLKAGRLPISVSWLAPWNQPRAVPKSGAAADSTGLAGGANRLEIYVQGPDLPRQKIPDAALFRKIIAPGTGAVSWEPGLAYQIFEGQWPCLPDFRQLAPDSSGVMNNFNPGDRTAGKNAAVRFSGWFALPRAGLYTFSDVCAGGSQLFLGGPRIEVAGSKLQAEGLNGDQPATLNPQPATLKVGETLPPNLKSCWAETEGEVTFITPQGPGAFQMELASGGDRMRVQVQDGAGIAPETLLGSRVRVTGICRAATSADGQPIAGVMWVPDAGWVAASRKSAANQNESAALSRDAATNLPTLTSLGQIMQLSREEVARGYPVKVRAVVIWSGRTACHIQDATAGLYADFHEAAADDVSLQPRVGELWEFEGVTEIRFSPVIVAKRATRLGLGVLPEPVHPALDQLLNGSLDGQYVELQGIVTAIQTNRLTLLTDGGKIQVFLVPPMWDGEPSVLATNADIQADWSGRQLAALKTYEGALVRVRGSLSPVKSRVTLQFKVGEIQIRAGSVSVDRAAPADPFDAPAKRAVELLMFDAQAAAFQPVKVTGEVVMEHAGEYFLMDGNQGLRFIPRQPVNLAPGDLVEVAGYPELGGPSPVLREASARKIGQTALPRPQRLLSDSPLILGNAGYDSTRVELEARLMNLSAERNDRVLELQMGSRFFVARLDKRFGEAVAIPVGSLLDLTGVYAGHIGTPGQGIDYFELLLNSPADIRVLARPSWWTLPRLAGVVSLLAGVVVAAFVWIGLLRRQVESRSAQLRREIHEREHAEQRHAIEAERSRIARDLHDDLGSSLTEISLLADAGPGAPPSLEKAGGRFGLISEKARALVNALDVIVWLVNPKKDSLPFLASYLGSYAEEFLAAAGTACRLKIPLALPPLPLSAETRHGLFLAVKEILNNAARHARAREVTMEMKMADGSLTGAVSHEPSLIISITDNGRGFDPATVAGGNGLSNLRERLARLGGRCDIQAQPGKGAAVTLLLPLTEHSQKAE